MERLQRHHLLFHVGEHGRVDPRPEIAFRLAFARVRREPDPHGLERAGVEYQLAGGPGATGSREDERSSLCIRVQLANPTAGWFPTENGNNGVA